MAWQHKGSSHQRGYGAAWRRLRASVLRRDKGICHVCGEGDANQVDHLVPKAQGGTDRMDNLAAIHDNPCHRRKSGHEGAMGQQAKSPGSAPRKVPRAVARISDRHPGLRP